MFSPDGVLLLSYGVGVLSRPAYVAVTEAGSYVFVTDSASGSVLCFVKGFTGMGVLFEVIWGSGPIAIDAIGLPIVAAGTFLIKLFGVSAPVQAFDIDGSAGLAICRSNNNNNNNIYVGQPLPARPPAGPLPARPLAHLSAHTVMEALAATLPALRALPFNLPPLS